MAGRKRTASAASPAGEPARPTGQDHNPFERLDDAIVLTDFGGVIRAANRTAALMLGVPPGRLCGKPLSVFLAADDPCDFHRRILKLERSGGIAEWRARVEGSSRCFEARVLVAVVGAHGRAAALRWIVRDEKGMQLAHLQQRETLERLRSIFESSLDGIIVNRLHDRTFLEVSDPFLRLVGHSREAVIGRRPSDVGLCVHESQEDEFFSALATHGRVPGSEIQLRSSDGRVLTTLVSATVVHVEGDRCVVCFVRDLTVEERAKAQILELERQNLERARLAELGAVVTRLVHDVGNPLSGIRLLAKAIRLRLDDAEGAPVANLADEMIYQIDRLQRIMRELKEIGRGARLELVEVDVVDLLRSLVAFWRPLAAEANVSLRLSSVPADLVIQADQAQISRVLDNLMKNAVDAVGHGPGAVTIEVSDAEGGRLRISVVDTGSGISDGFDPFELFATTKPDGVGLGLSVSREIADAHGGELSFERRVPSGTAFHLDLPRRAPDRSREPWRSKAG